MRVAIAAGMGVAQGLISALMLLLAVSGVGVQSHAVLIGRQGDWVPQEDERTPCSPELVLDGVINTVEVTAVLEKEEELSEPDLRCVFKAIGQ